MRNLYYISTFVSYLTHGKLKISINNNKNELKMLSCIDNDKIHIWRTFKISKVINF